MVSDDMKSSEADNNASGWPKLVLACGTLWCLGTVVIFIIVELNRVPTPMTQWLGKIFALFVP
jgi:hypothetical protein